MAHTNPEKVVNLLKSRRGEPLCDDCICTTIGAGNRVSINPITSTLGLTGEYRREKAECGHCHSVKYVTHRI